VLLADYSAGRFPGFPPSIVSTTSLVFKLIILTILNTNVVSLTDKDCCKKLST
jgi:hypothetical protein